MAAVYIARMNRNQSEMLGCHLYRHGDVICQEEINRWPFVRQRVLEVFKGVNFTDEQKNGLRMLTAENLNHLEEVCLHSKQCVAYCCCCCL